MPDLLTVWGRASSVNVMKVLWLLDELAIPFDRIEAGGAFGRTARPRLRGDEPQRHGADAGHAAWLFAVGEPFDPALPLPHPARRQRLLPGGAGSAGGCRALDGLDAGLDERADAGGLLGAGPHAGSRARHGGGGPGARRGGTAVADRRGAAGRAGLRRRAFSIADMALGGFLHRWYALPITRATCRGCAGWYERLLARPAYAKHVAVPLT